MHKTILHLFLRVHVCKYLCVHCIYWLQPTSRIGGLGDHRCGLTFAHGCGRRNPELVHLILGQAA